MRSYLPLFSREPRSSFLIKLMNLIYVHNVHDVLLKTLFSTERERKVEKDQLYELCIDLIFILEEWTYERIF
jgi:hypothetical protein